MWPIVAPSNDTLTKKKSTEDIVSHDATLGELSGQTTTTTTTTKKSDTPASSRKQQNIIPLLNAMRVTNAHSAASFISHTSEDMPLEASQELSQSSGTSVPREETPGVHKPSVPQDSSATSSRPSIAGGKKKRKRSCLSYFYFTDSGSVILEFRNIERCWRNNLIMLLRHFELRHNATTRSTLSHYLIVPHDRRLLV